MPVVLYRLLRSGLPAGGQPGGGILRRAEPYAPLTPGQVRARRFSTVRWGRRGLDPAEVCRFLDRVATDLGLLHAEVTRVREQNNRIKAALRRWQTRQNEPPVASSPAGSSPAVSPEGSVADQGHRRPGQGQRRL